MIALIAQERKRKYKVKEKPRYKKKQQHGMKK